ESRSFIVFSLSRDCIWRSNFVWDESITNTSLYTNENPYCINLPRNEPSALAAFKSLTARAIVAHLINGATDGGREVSTHGTLRQYVGGLDGTGDGLGSGLIKGRGA